MDLPSFDYYADSQRKCTRKLLMQELFEEDSEKWRNDDAFSKIYRLKKNKSYLSIYILPLIKTLFSIMFVEKPQLFLINALVHFQKQSSHFNTLRYSTEDVKLQ